MLFALLRRKRAESEARKGSLPNSKELPLHHPTDPVELRRLNFQTPGRCSHLPCPTLSFLRSNATSSEQVEDGQVFRGGLRRSASSLGELPEAEVQAGHFFADAISSWRSRGRGVLAHGGFYFRRWGGAEEL